MTNKTSSSGTSASKRKQIQQQRQKKEQQRRIFIVLMIAGVALVVMAAIVIPNLVPAKEVTAITPVARPQANGREMGNPDAKVVVEVFSDFQCPACRNFAQSIEPLIVNSYVQDGRVLFIYRQFPFLDDRVAKKESDQAANASMCAADQGKFWELHDVIFANWNGENQGAYSDKRLIAMAESVGLDMTAFKKCFNSNQFKSDIQADLAKGTQLGVNSTPSVFVNGALVDSPDPTSIQQAIEAALASSN
jgi:protein-disulfide isomerase